MMAGKKTIYNGILFDSQFEASIYKILIDNNVNITSTHPEFELFSDFTYQDMTGKIRKVRNMKYTGDFLINSPSLDKPIILETKNGIITNDYLMRRKLFLMKYSNDYYFQQINSKRELDEIMDKLV